MKKVYLTTPIYYVNGNPHVGHAHTSVMGDILKREYQMCGYDVFFTTGVDEHGQKNQTSIEASGLSAQEYLDRQSHIFRELFDLLNVKYDKFVRTTDEAHVRIVQHILSTVYDMGLIVKKEYEGLYCVGCEMFKTSADLDENGLCVDHQTKPISMKEVNYFFRLSVYQDWLIDFIRSHPDWIQPEHFQSELLHMLEEPLPDLCISRPKSRCKLGIELPFDSDYVTYVWFDALINYISSLAYSTSEARMEYWDNSIHLMAKDIIKTHCIYWPIMLKAIGLEPQTKNLVHGYWTGEGGIKMSKTIGNVVDPYQVIRQFGVDPFRYFLARTMGENESSMSYALIKNCYNTEIVNSVCNAVYRTMKLANKTYHGVYPAVTAFEEKDETFIRELAAEASAIVGQAPSLRQIYQRASDIREFARKINGFFDRCAPWTLAKKESLDEFNSCILTCVEALRLMAEIAFPIIPETSLAILRSMGIGFDPENALEIKTRVICAGMTFEEPNILYQRMD